MKNLSQLTVEPGKGKGAGFAPRGAGGTDTCVCPKCGTKAAHSRSQPCVDLKCPKCGSPMQGSND